MISPMIDMSFLLLVFFVVSTMSMSEVKTVPVQLPAASQVQLQQSSQFAVTVKADGSLYLGTTPITQDTLLAQPSQAVSRPQVHPSSELPLPGAPLAPAANASAPLEAPEPAGAAAGSSTGTGTGTGTGSGTETGSGDGSGTGEGTGGGGPSFDVDAIQPDVSPELLSSVPAAYPEQLRSYGIQGSVRVQLVVGKDGSVETASVIASSGYGLMDQAALDAAYGYTFSPAYKEGIPVRCYATRTFRFYLH